MTRRWIKVLVAILFSLGGLTPASSSASSSIEDVCEQHWKHDSSITENPDSEAGLKSLLERWSSRSAECGATAAYWGRRATVEIQLGAAKAARESVGRGRRVQPAGNRVVELASIMIDVQERLLGSEPLTDVDLERFEVAYRRLVARYPGWPAAYAMLGDIQTMRARYQEAVQSLNEAVKGTDFQLWGVYRNLAVSLSALGRHSEAASAAGKAFGQNKAVMNDSEFSCALAISLVEIGNVAGAKSVLELLVMRQPSVKSESIFIRADSIVQAAANRSVQQR